jgi:hypothetical protein
MPSNGFKRNFLLGLCQPLIHWVGNVERKAANSLIMALLTVLLVIYIIGCILLAISTTCGFETRSSPRRNTSGFSTKDPYRILLGKMWGRVLAGSSILGVQIHIAQLLYINFIADTRTNFCSLKTDIGKNLCFGSGSGSAWIRIVLGLSDPNPVAMKSAKIDIFYADSDPISFILFFPRYHVSLFHCLQRPSCHPSSMVCRPSCQPFRW